MSLLRGTALLALAVLALAVVGYGVALAATPTGVPPDLDVVVEARQFSYQPEVLRVAPGQRVRLTLKAMDVTHGLYLDDYGLELHATPGHPEQLEFVAGKQGVVRFRCTQTCGPLHPFMVGKLEVAPNTPFNLGLGALVMASLGAAGMLWLGRPALPRLAGGAPITTGAALSRVTMTKLDLLRVPVLGRWFRWRGFQFSLILPLLAFLMLAIVAAVRGTPIGSHNFAIVFVWIVWWPLLIIVLIPLGGRFWCAVCPLPAPGEWLQRLAMVGKRAGLPFGAGRRWPAMLRNMWLQNAAFALIALLSTVVLTTPMATAAVLGAFFVAALLLAPLYAGRVFCRYVCPLGGFIGLCSLVAPLALRVKDRDVCRGHREKQCVKGSPAGYGCPWFEYPGTMRRNAYCGLCMECVKTCSRQNIAVALQPLGYDLAAGKPRLDEAFRTFIALGSAGLYTAVMLGPWGWLKSLAGNPLSPSFLLYAALLLAICLLIVPALFLAAASLARLAADAPSVSTAKLWQTLSYGLVPLALMVWIAFSLAIVAASGHYVVPVVSDPLGHGWNLFGTAGLEGGPVLMDILPYLQMSALLLGLLWSIQVSWRLASTIFVERARARRGMLPVIGFLLLSAAAFLWLFVG